MVEMKGSVIIDSIDAVKKRSGEQAYQSILKALDEETKILFESKISISSWYPLDRFLNFLELDLKLTAGGNEKELISRSEAIIEKQLKGIYDVFVKPDSPGYILDQLSIINQIYYKGVLIDIKVKRGNKAVIRYTGFEKKHRLIEFSILGFYKKALEISGARDVKAEFTTKIEDNKGYCELSITWGKS